MFCKLMTKIIHLIKVLSVEKNYLKKIVEIWNNLKNY